jgi:hypothetical protein
MNYFLLKCICSEPRKVDKYMIENALYSQSYTLYNLFGGYATLRKHVVFSRLVLNSYIKINLSAQVTWI